MTESQDAVNGVVGVGNQRTCQQRHKFICRYFLLVRDVRVDAPRRFDPRFTHGKIIDQMFNSTGGMFGVSTSVSAIDVISLSYSARSTGQARPISSMICHQADR